VVVTARYLGPAGKGILSLSALLVGIAFLFADVGLTKSLTYHVSKGEMDEPTALAVSAYGAALLGGAVIAVALLLEPWLRQVLFEGMSHRVYTVSLASLPGAVFIQFWITVKTARRRFAVAAAFQFGQSVLALGVAVAVLAVIGGDIETLVTGNTVVVLSLATGVLVVSIVRQGFTARTPGSLILRILKYGVAAYGGSLSNYALLRVDMLVLNAVFGNAAVGQYSVAVSMTESLWHIDNAMGRAVMPDVVSSKQTDAATLVAASGRMMVLVGGSLAIGIFLAAPWLVQWLFGPAFVESVAALRVLLPGAICLSVARLVLQYHQGNLGRPGQASLVLAGSAASGLALYLLLVPQFGIVGAASASSIVYAATLIVALVMFRREADISPWRVVVPCREDVERLLQLAKALLRAGGRHT